MLLKTWGTSEVLNDSAIEEIYGKALHVLKDIGVRVENKWMVDRLVSHGAQSKEPFVVTFPEHLMDDMIRNALPFDWETVPELSFTAGANPQYYMAAGTDHVCENTLASIERLTKLADRLEHVSRIHLMGAASDILPALTPLYARVIGWKYIANTKFDCCEIWDDDTIDYVSEMVDEYKAESGQTENGNLETRRRAEMPREAGRTPCRASRSPFRPRRAATLCSFSALPFRSTPQSSLHRFRRRSPHPSTTPPEFRSAFLGQLIP